jgi:hypothetical protein
VTGGSKLKRVLIFRHIFLTPALSYQLSAFDDAMIRDAFAGSAGFILPKKGRCEITSAGAEARVCFDFTRR